MTGPLSCAGEILKTPYLFLNLRAQEAAELGKVSPQFSLPVLDHPSYVD